MSTASFVGMGVGFLVVGAIFGLLSIFKPNSAIFKKYTKEQFYRTQGMLTMFVAFGIMMILMGLLNI